MRCRLRMTKQLLHVRNIPQKLQNNNPCVSTELGFTLLETLIVLTCFSALLFIALPGYRHVIAEHELRNSAQLLLADLRECRMLAAAESQQYSLQFHNSVAYSIQGGTFNKQVQFPTGITISTVKMGLGSDVIAFNDKGHPARAGSVILQNREGKSVKIIIYLHSGQVEIMEE